MRCSEVFPDNFHGATMGALRDNIAPPDWHVFTRTYPHDRLVSPLLFTIHHAMGQPWITHGWLEEQNHRLIERLPLVHREIGQEIERLPAVRASTRVEIYQRLHRARDFMRAS